MSIPKCCIKENIGLLTHMECQQFLAMEVKELVGLLTSLKSVLPRADRGWTISVEQNSALWMIWLYDVTLFLQRLLVLYDLLRFSDRNLFTSRLYYRLWPNHVPCHEHGTGARKRKNAEDTTDVNGTDPNQRQKRRKV